MKAVCLSVPCARRRKGACENGFCRFLGMTNRRRFPTYLLYDLVKVLSTFGMRIMVEIALGRPNPHWTSAAPDIGRGVRPRRPLGSGQFCKLPCAGCCQFGSGQFCKLPLRKLLPVWQRTTLQAPLCKGLTEGSVCPVGTCPAGAQRPEGYQPKRAEQPAGRSATIEVAELSRSD